MWHQTTIQLKARGRGYHLVTGEIISKISELKNIRVGLCHISLLHTSASLTINENADPDVRADFELFLNRMVPENMPGIAHTLEGSDDMPAHVKSSLIGTNLVLSISNGHLNLGTWQGIYLCEHRDHAPGRRIIVTVHGDT